MPRCEAVRDGTIGGDDVPKADAGQPEVAARTRREAAPLSFMTWVFGML